MTDPVGLIPAGGWPLTIARAAVMDDLFEHVDDVLPQVRAAWDGEGENALWNHRYDAAIAAVRSASGRKWWKPERGRPVPNHNPGMGMVPPIDPARLQSRLA